MTALPASLRDDWTALLKLVADQALMLHAPETGSGLSGTDYDCAVLNLDHSWPLRLTGGWSLCQRVHYDPLDWFWVLERDGAVFSLDTIGDWDGLGRDGFPVKIFMRDHKLDAPPAARGAYLTAKRIRKRMTGEREWQRIGTLARSDAAAYAEALSAVVGPRLSRATAASALAGEPPEPVLLRQAFWLQVLRRFRTPWRALRVFVLATCRAVERVSRPVGMLVLVAGPDGAGKSTLSAQLPSACESLFHLYRHAHWRPGILPRPGALLGHAEPVSSEPHARPPHGRAVSVFLLFYFWIDFFVGSWTRFALTRIRFGLVVLERGWWDIAVDPRRYRLNVPPVLVRLLGRALPRPDIALILEGPAATLVERKHELDVEEMERQLVWWRTASVGKLATSHLDAARTQSEIVSAARNVIISNLERRSVSRIGAGWANLPGRRAARWYLPRGNRRTAAAALAVYQPVTGRARAGWSAAHAVARAGGFRLLPRGQAPPRAVREIVAPYIPSHGNLAVARMTHPNRYIAAILDRHGVPRLIAKVTTDEQGARSLAKEVSAIEEMTHLLPTPLSVPSIVAHEPRIVVFEFVPWLPRRDATELPEEVAFALGQFYRTCAADNRTGAVHGDFAPWNILQTTEGWTLLDWEAASSSGHSFEDICHYFVQSHALLGRPSQDAIVDGFRRGTGKIGAAVRAYADGAKLDADLAARSLQSYLVTSAHSLLPADRDRGAMIRGRIIRRLER